MSVATEVLVVYRCPHCRAELEAEDDGWRGWRLCPDCGKPGLPPEPRRHDAAVSAPGEGAKASAWIASGDLFDPVRPDARTRAARRIGPRRATSPAVRRLIAGGLAVCLFLLLVAFLDGDLRLATGSGAMVAALLWARANLGPERP